MNGGGQGGKRPFSETSPFLSSYPWEDHLLPCSLSYLLLLVVLFLFCFGLVFGQAQIPQLLWGILIGSLEQMWEVKCSFS